MNGILTFLIELLLVSAAFCMGYLIIKNHTTATFRRFYLLAWMIFSVSFPLITVESSGSPNTSIRQMVQESYDRPQPNLELKEYYELELSGKAQEEATTDAVSDKMVSKKTDWGWYLMVVYFLVAGALLLRTVLGIVQIFRLKRGATRLPEFDGSVFQINDSKFKGASFFGWIFIGQAVDTDREVILQHEQVHSRSWHSMDILLSHIYCAVFWANPFSWLLKKYIGLNTELETDAHIARKEGQKNYADVLLSLTNEMQGSVIMNHFSAFYLKARIIALSRKVRHRKWVSVFTTATVLGLFFLISCESVDSPEVMVERLNNVKTITTRFTSHQSDTQQKTGKIVAIASFGPDGTLEELVEQTTYPYDREFEVKKQFWDTPEKKGIPYIMDGLSLGDAEKSILYGNDWPSAYYKHLYEKTQSRDMPWSEVIKTDNEDLPTEISKEIEYENDGIFMFGSPDVTEYFEYENEKVVSVSHKLTFKEFDSDKAKAFRFSSKKEDEKFYKELEARNREVSGKTKQVEAYTYDGDLLTSIKTKDAERKFYYENNLLTKSEYYRNGELLNTRIHYYKNSLKNRTEIFNRYNEPEYTITYEYEFW